MTIVGVMALAGAGRQEIKKMLPRICNEIWFCHTISPAEIESTIGSAHRTMIARRERAIDSSAK